MTTHVHARRVPALPGRAAPGRRWLALAARGAFVSGMDLGLLTGALVAFAGCAVALAVLPDGRRTAGRADTAANEVPTRSMRGIGR